MEIRSVPHLLVLVLIRPMDVLPNTPGSQSSKADLLACFIFEYLGFKGYQSIIQ